MTAPAPQPNLFETNEPAELTREAPRLAEMPDVSMIASVSVAAVQAAPLDVEAWQVIRILPRLDAETHMDLMTEIHEVLAEGARRVALDLTQNHFFSLNAIQLCVSLARDLADDDGGFALIGCGERTKKHFEIYGSLKQIVIVRSVEELVRAGQSLVHRSRRA